MRRIQEHRFESGGFDEAVRGLVQSSPWWMISLVIHAIVLAVFWAIPFDPGTRDKGPVLQAELPKEIQQPEDDAKIDPPEPELEDVEEVETLDVEEVAEVPSVDLDQDDLATAGEEGMADSFITGPYDNSAIGLGPRAGGGRRGPGGNRTGGPQGGPPATRSAVDLGLKWLADHQDVDGDGRWDSDEYMKHDPADDRCTGPGGALHDVGVTGLALLAFLGAGYTDRGTDEENPFARNVRAGLRYLRSVQDEQGVFGSRASHSFMYSHAIATLAMCEAYWMTRNPAYKKPAQDAVNFLAMARNPYMAWRYEPRGGDNDTSVTGWCVMALKSAKYAGLEVDPSAFDGARLWIDKMTDPNFGQVGYNTTGGASARPEGKQDRFPPEKTQSMTAVGVLTRIFLGEDPRTSPMIRKGADLCVEMPPRWNPDDGSIDMYYWYYATLAMFQVGGTHWRQWDKAMVDAIVSSQHGKNAGSRKGSWDPIGAWGDDGGRVYATALMVMCLEVYYRYDRVFGGVRSG